MEDDVMKDFPLLFPCCVFAVAWLSAHVELNVGNKPQNKRPLAYAFAATISFLFVSGAIVLVFESSLDFAQLASLLIVAPCYLLYVKSVAKQLNKPASS